MSAFNYRFSVIPAGAITDERLSPRALQVLCLLGRHTNDNGWCSRSQVKMAREIRCSRAALYDAVELLLATGWIERRRNGRGGTGPEASAQPFAAYSYRVVLDRDDLPARVRPDDATAAEAAEPAEAQSRGGAAPAAGGAAPAAGGAAPGAAPLEGSPSKGIPAEPERECARARDGEAGDRDRAGRDKRLARLKAQWPTAALDDQARIGKAWDSLTEDEQEAALGGVEAFLAALKRHRRSHPPTLWRYLDERRWTLLDEAKPRTVQAVTCWSREWWAVLLARADRGQSLSWMVQYATERGGAWGVQPQDMPPPESVAALKAYPGDGTEMAAWRPWLAARGGHALPQWRERIWVFLPAPQPPPPGEGALPATGPPQAA